LTAKDKICLNPEAACDPEECPYAKGYYDRVRGAIEDVFHQDGWTRALVEEYARRHRVCPFEFQLDLSLLADGIICDYNYVFDPRVYLRRFFAEEEGEGGSYAFVIDEAHNLVDRAREMFSAVLSKRPVLAVKQKLSLQGSRKTAHPALHALYQALRDLNQRLIEERKRCAEEGTQEGKGTAFLVREDAPEELYPVVRRFLVSAEAALASPAVKLPASCEDELLDLYFAAHSFLRTAEYYDGDYRTYCEQDGNEISVKLFCVNPARLLQQALARGRSAVFVSATLTPLDYFRTVLGGDASSASVRLPSPFPQENLRVLLNANIATTYQKRALSYDGIAEQVAELVRAKVGNYLVYFPSYRYLREVHARFCDRNPQATVLAQNEHMSDRDREEFLDAFSRFGERTLVGFAVLGGVFGEGIDLTGERLSGVVIVGVGLPQICAEREIIREYFNGENGRGFEYAYMYPGMNKVLQAAGRVIRSETDRGVILLIDERFQRYAYRELFPPEWRPLHMVRARPGSTCYDLVSSFWAMK
jgi:DNA excision repair protein ERCC-2